MEVNEPNIQLEEMRTYVFEAIRYFKSKSDNTSNYPDVKLINNLKWKVEELIVKKYLPDFYTSGNNIPVKRMNRHNRHQFLETVQNLQNEGVIMWGNAFDRDTDTYPYFSITSYGQKVLDANELIPHEPGVRFKNGKDL